MSFGTYVIIAAAVVGLALLICSFMDYNKWRH